VTGSAGGLGLAEQEQLPRRAAPDRRADPRPATHDRGRQSQLRAQPPRLGAGRRAL